MADLIVPTRRSFLLGAASLVAAPAIVRVASIMPVSAGWSLPTVDVRIEADFETDIMRACARQRWIGNGGGLVTGAFSEIYPGIRTREEAIAEVRRKMNAGALAVMRDGYVPRRRFPPTDEPLLYGFTVQYDAPKSVDMAMTIKPQSPS